MLDYKWAAVVTLVADVQGTDAGDHTPDVYDCRVGIRNRDLRSVDR